VKYYSILIIIISQLFFSSPLLANVGTTNHTCKVWQKQNFAENFDSSDFNEIMYCMNTITTLISESVKLCLMAENILQNNNSDVEQAKKIMEFKEKSEGIVVENKKFAAKMFVVGKVTSLKTMGSNVENVSLKAVVQSFLNFSDNHPELWNEPVGFSSRIWLSEKWPCKLSTDAE
tara:strand:+ start:176 stop:700 length:525 start_codon:yes stop_codon:yes gene_type:complete